MCVEEYMLSTIKISVMSKVEDNVAYSFVLVLLGGGFFQFELRYIYINLTTKMDNNNN